MSAQGWIKLHRKMVEWEWYDDHNTCRLFIHILLKCHRKEKRYRGTTIPAGSLATGRSKLAAETGLSERQIRTVLDKLKSTNDVTIETTSEYSIISVVNWGEYQSSDQQSDQPPTSKRPAESPRDVTQNVRETTNHSHIKNDENSYSCVDATNISDQQNVQRTTSKASADVLDSDHNTRRQEERRKKDVVVSRADENPKTLLEEVTKIAEIDVGKQQSWFHQASIISELEQKHGRETVLAAARRGRDSAAASGSVMGSPRYLIPICQTIEAERNRPAPSGTGSPPSGPSDETPEQTLARLRAKGLIKDDPVEDNEQEACHG